MLELVTLIITAALEEAYKLLRLFLGVLVALNEVVKLEEESGEAGSDEGADDVDPHVLGVIRTIRESRRTIRVFNTNHVDGLSDTDCGVKAATRASAHA